MLEWQPELGPILFSATGKLGSLTYVCTGLFLKLALFFSVYSISINHSEAGSSVLTVPLSTVPAPQSTCSPCASRTQPPGVMFNLVTSMEAGH